MKSRDFTKKLLETKKDFRKEYLAKDRALELGHLVVEERLKVGLTQKELAEKISTQQPSIARIENGAVVPDIETLDKIMVALKAELVFSVRRGTTYTFTDASPKVPQYAKLSSNSYVFFSNKNRGNSQDSTTN